MIPRKFAGSVSSLCSLFLILPPSRCHMEMSWPYPLRSKFNPANSYNDIDYSMTSPLEADGSDFPCKGYQNDRPVQTTVTYTTGSTYNMTLSGSAMHEGGSCQLSLSYDNGATFKVIKSIIGGCPLTPVFDFTIPSYAPAGTALLAWSWQNIEGNREFYMNCAEVSVISGGGSRRHRRRQQSSLSSFDQLPYLWKANLAGINTCATVESTDTVYPHPGPDVEYGDSLSTSSAPSPGDCDEPTPYGQTYRDLGDSSIPASSGTAVSQSPPATAADSFSASGSDSSPSLPNPNANQRQPAYQSTTTITADCPGTITMTVYPSNSWTTTMTVTSLPQANAGSGASSTLSITSTYTVTPVQSSQASSPAGHPPYATGNVELYLPCVPGTFICTTNTTWDTCDHNDGSVSGASSSSWVYDAPRNVAAGMKCITFLSPYANSTQQYAQQSMTPYGYYRDDRVVRARPDGDCSNDGSIQCTNGGDMFEVCDQGGWVNMGSVAAGTTCQNGQIVASS